MVRPTDGRRIAGIGGDDGTIWRQVNAVWNGRGIALDGALGETLAFQLVLLRGADEFVRDLRIELEMDGIEHVGTWRAWCIWGIPDVAVPLDGVEPFDIPPNNPLESRAWAETEAMPLAWPLGLEFTVPRDARTGHRHGRLRVTAHGASTLREFPVELNVYPFALPVRPRYLVEMNSYGDWASRCDNTPETYRALHHLFRAHRCTFMQVPYRQPGNLASPFLSPRFDLDAPKGPGADFTRFDVELGGLFDGSAFPDGEPISHFELPFGYNTPVRFALRRHDPARYASLHVAVRRAFLRHAHEKGWTRTVFQEFHNENIDNGAVTCPWFLDEPRSAADLEGHRLFLDIFEQARRDAPDDVRFRYRIDISQWQALGPSFHGIAGRIQDWVVSRDRQYLNNGSAPMFRDLADRHGGMLLEYGEMRGFCVDGRAVSPSMIAEYPRNCLEWGLDGFEQWIVDMWGVRGEGQNAAAASLLASSAGGMRDWIWPGHVLGSMLPFPSLRLKALRATLNLFDYAALAAEQTPSHAFAIETRLRDLSLDTSDGLHALRRDLARELASTGA